MLILGHLFKASGGAKMVLIYSWPLTDNSEIKPIVSINTKLKQKYFASRVSKFKGNFKETWKTIYQLFDKRSKSTNTDLLQDQNTTISRKGELFQSINSFFCSIIKYLSSNTDVVYYPLVLCNSFLNSNAAKPTFISIHAQQITEAISKFKTPKKCGHKDISSYFIKLAMPFIEEYLVYLFNT